MIRIAFVVLCIIFLVAGLWLIPLLEGHITSEKMIVARVGLFFLAIMSIAIAVAYWRIVERLQLLASASRTSFPGTIEYLRIPRKMETILLYAFAPLLFGLTVLVFIERDIAVFIAREDGILENATAVFYLISAALNIRLLIHCRIMTLLRINLGLLAFLFFFVGMEEISWGQRIFDIQTPEALKRINVQDELTLHNIWSISLTVYPALFVTSTLLCFFPLLNQNAPKIRLFLSSFQIPIAAVVYGYWYIVLVVTYLTIGFRLGTPTPLPIAWYDVPPHIDDEFLEFFIGYLFLTVSLGLWRIKLPNDTRGLPH